VFGDGFENDMVEFEEDGKFEKLRIGEYVAGVGL
jgi:hypothetical protein